MTDPVSSLLPNAPAAAAPASAAATGPAISSDFETFLKMLTVQMENQDPLNPVDSSDYAVQLATFSSVEQQVRTNDLLGAMLGQTAGGGLAEYSGWVGMQARSTAPVLFDGSAVPVNFERFDQVDAATLVVTNEQGIVVQRRDLPLESDDFVWDGLDSGGAPHPPGLYRFDVEHFIDGALVETRPAQTYSEVEEVRSEPTGTLLVLAGGTAVLPQAITALRGADG